MRGRQFAADLSAASIPTILIPDANVLALLPRCSKAILSPHLVLADGSLVSSTGSYPLALAARKMRVPLVVVAGMYKFCPSYGGGHEEGDPSAVLDDSTLSNDQQPHDNHRHHSSSSHGATGDQDGSDAGHTNVRNPLWDRVPSKLVDLYITNLSVLAPCVIMSLILRCLTVQGRTSCQLDRQADGRHVRSFIVQIRLLSNERKTEK